MLKLRDYQQQAVDHSIKRMQEGCSRMHFTLPVAAGKSFILAAFALHQSSSGRILVLIHRQDIAKQLAATFEQAGLHTGLLMQGYSNIESDVVVATTQSLTSIMVQRLIHASERPIAAICIDEAHHAVKGSAYERIITEVEAAFPQRNIPVLGCTATPYRSDKQSMLSLLPTCVYARDIPDMVREGILAALMWKPLRVTIDLSEVAVKQQDGESDFDEEALSSQLVRQVIIEAIAQLVTSQIEQRPTLVFAASVEHAELLTSAFCHLGLSAQTVSGRQSRTEREHIFEQWRAGSTQIVCNCSLLTEGYDFPAIAALVIARPTRSPSLYMQMLGRGLRLAPGKQNCLVLDVMGNDPDLSKQVVLPHIVGDTQAQGGQILHRKETSDPLLKALDGPYSTSLSLLDPIGQSRYRWLPYQLKSFEGYFAKISQYERAIIERDPEGSGLYRSRLYEKQTQQLAQHTWIEHHYLPLRQQIALVHKATDAWSSKALSGKEATWLSLPATEKQLQTLQRLDIQAARAARTTAWTRQEVSDRITFLFLRGTLTNPPSIPQEEVNGDVAS